MPDAELEYDEELVCRWRGELFAGIGYADTSSAGLSEVSYRYGVQDSSARDWYSSGTLKGESQFREGIQHGTARELDVGGVVSSEAVLTRGGERCSTELVRALTRGLGLEFCQPRPWRRSLT